MPVHRMSVLPALAALVLFAACTQQAPTDEETDPGSLSQPVSTISGTVASPGAGAASVPGSWWTDDAAVGTRQAAAGAASDGTLPGEYLVRLRPAAGGVMAQTLSTLSVPGAQLQLVRPLGVPGLGLYRAQPVLGAQSLSKAAFSRTVLNELSARSDVLYAEPNRWLHALAVPNDKLFPLQWNLQAINLPAAWDTTTGSAVTVAVVDTGIVAHPDLGGKVLPGYDFVSDPVNAADGGGRDADPTDPGGGSDDHGSHVAGILAAASNNGAGIAGVSWGARILPVRVLGRDGGGTLADILDGISWAAGLPVSGVITNPYPARIINLSLGGAGVCAKAAQDTINAVLARNVVVVAAAGNSSTDASTDIPANCGGVIAVGATGPDGQRAFYSNYGARIDVMAPGGDTNVLLRLGGQQVPGGVISTVGDDSASPPAYIYASYQGTSQAAPHVSGVAALLLSLRPTLTPAQVLSVLKTSARPLGTAECGGVAGGCGAGLIDAAAALRGSGSVPAPTPPAPVTQVKTLVAALYRLPQGFDAARSPYVLLDQKGLKNAYSLQTAHVGSYAVVAWQDLNGNKQVDEGEPFGQYANDIILDRAGRVLAGIDIDLKPYASLGTASSTRAQVAQAMQQMQERSTP